MLSTEQVLVLVLAAWAFAYFYIALKVSGIPLARAW